MPKRQSRPRTQADAVIGQPGKVDVLPRLQVVNRPPQVLGPLDLLITNGMLPHVTNLRSAFVKPLIDRKHKGPPALDEEAHIEQADVLGVGQNRA